MDVIERVAGPHRRALVGREVDLGVADRLLLQVEELCKRSQVVQRIVHAVVVVVTRTRWGQQQAVAQRRGGVLLCTSRDRRGASSGSARRLLRASPRCCLC